LAGTTKRADGGAGERGPQKKSQVKNDRNKFGKSIRENQRKMLMGAKQHLTASEGTGKVRGRKINPGGEPPPLG